MDREIGEDQHANLVTAFTEIVDLIPFRNRLVMIREFIQKVKTWQRPAHEIFTPDGIVAMIDAMEGYEELQEVIEVVRSFVFPSQPEFRDEVLGRLEVSDIENGD